MIAGRDVVARLERHGIDFTSGVPCSLVEDVIAVLDPRACRTPPRPARTRPSAAREMDARMQAPKAMLRVQGRPILTRLLDDLARRRGRAGGEPRRVGGAAACGR